MFTYVVYLTSEALQTCRRAHAWLQQIRAQTLNWGEHSSLKTLYQIQHKAGFRDYSSRSRAGGRGNKIKIHRFGRSKKMKVVMVVRRKKEEEEARRRAE